MHKGHRSWSTRLGIAIPVVLLTTSHAPQVPRSQFIDGAQYPGDSRKEGTAGDRRPEVPRFEEGTQVFDNEARVWESALADLDGDGHLDLVFTSLGSATQVLFNDGTGHFRNSGQALASGTHGIAIDDLDGDGDQDLFLAVLGRDRPSAIYVNDGSGSFTRTNINLPLPSSERVALVDIDGDGDLDAYLWYSGRLYVNDGTGTFSQSPTTLPRSPAFADLNGDGVVDVLSTPPGRGFGIHLNDGAGTFIEHGFLPKPDLKFSYVGFVDVDNDRDMDVVFSNGDDAVTHASGVLVNDGMGRLVDSGQELSRVGYGFVCTGDLNADGWADVILTDRDKPPRIWLNEGGGRFVDSGVSLGIGGLWNNCTIADIDGDGDLDVFVTRVFRGNHGVWFNRWIEDGGKRAARGASPGP